jgi:alkylation response protein AidB-like acyl-CoA dehydrogenase
MTTTQTTSLTKGGEFLIKASRPEDIFTPEDYTEEQHMFRKSMRDFLDKELEPVKEKFDTVEGTTIAPGLLEQMGELGFHGIGVPDSFGGLGADFKTELAFGEIASDSFSFAQSIGVHTGLGIYPVLYYGTPEQQAKYLPDIIAAKTKCSYCLTEPGSGSDANAARSRAVLSADGTHYVLNGQKMWITNSGFADVFFVFCKIEDDKNLSCLIVHKEYGVKLGAEERKLGIHGSSTRQVFFEDVKVPVENLIGERDKGFKIAMNALNAGRIKIAVANSAIAKRAFRLGVSYANQRVQFGQPIASFGAIQRKIATMATRIYANDSAWNRVAHQVDQVLEHMIVGGMPELEAKQRSVAEFALECAMTKVYGSEMEQLVVDEALQIHGGMGYSAESEISTLYRNIRGNRIYEGTNEINRLLMPTTLLRKAMKGEVALMPAAMQAFQDLQAGKLNPPADNGEPFGLELAFLAVAKQVTILAAGQAMQRFQEAIKDEQEVLMELADMLTQVFMYESALLRAIKHRDKPSMEVTHAMVTVLMHDTAEVLRRAMREVVCASAKGDMADMTVKALIRLLNLPAHDLKETRRKIAAHFIARNAYEL